jgi:hypothetical protein
MELRVDPTAIQAYADDLRQHATDAGAIRRYAATYTAFGWHEEGLINIFWQAHRTFADQVSHTLAHLHELLTASQLELAKVAMFYRLCDRVTAARLDRAYPCVPRSSPAIAATE